MRDGMRNASQDHAHDDDHDTKVNLSTLKPYLRLLSHHKADLVWVHLLMILSTGVSLAIPLYAGRFVDALTQTKNIVQNGGGANGLTATEPGTMVALLAGLLILQLLTTYLHSVIAAHFGLSYITTLRKRLMTQLLDLPSLYFTHQKAGDLSSRMTSDVGSLQFLMTSGLASLARAVLTLGGAIALMLHLNVRLSLVILALVPATILLVRLFGSRLRKLSRRMYEELGLISSHVQEVVGAIRVIKVYNNQDHERHRFDGMVDRYYRAGVSRAKLSAGLESGAQILLWICLITIVVYGFYLTAEGQTSYGQLVAFFLLAYRVALPLSTLTSLYASAQGAVAAAGRLDGIFAIQPERRGRSTTPPMAESRGEVTLENVTFTYETAPVIQDLSLHIAEGEWVGIVGPSGAGKTTLSGLILGLFPPDRGRLLLDGHSYAEFDLADLRRHMAYVSQEPILYDASVKDNIRFGLEDSGGNAAGDEAIREAAARANALEFIDALPLGFDTEVGERGVRLSGGERQRITLARAFLRNPRILMLDEPTSALDAESEEAVRAALRALMRGRTAIVIAHRLSLVRDLDRIFVLARGRLVEEGSHAQLIQQQGLYSNLYQLQHGSVAGGSA